MIGASIHMPEGWKSMPLSDLASFRTGPFGSTFHKSDYQSGGVPLINPSHIVDGEIVPDEQVAVAQELASQLSVFALRENDIVIGRRGDMGRCAVVRAHQAGFLCGTGSMIVRPRPGVSSELLQAFLASPKVIAKIEENSVGTTMINLNQGTLASLEILLPENQAGQQAIAAALSDADGVVAGLERAITKKRLIKQGAMQDLLSARRRLPGFSGEWEMKPFAQIAKIRNSKVQTLGNPTATNCIELEQVEHETGRILFLVDATSRPSVKYQFEPGDVLFGRLRPYLRKFHWAAVQGVCSTEIWPLMTQGVDSGFLYQVVQSNGFIGAACEAYGTHMPRADWGKLATYEVQVPIDPKEQMAIGEVLADMEKEIQALGSRLTKARAVKEGMMQNLLTGRVRLV